MAQGNHVAYYRVSTAKQGASGLGLAAQQTAVRSYLNGGSWNLVGEFTEVESGKKNDRAQLALAIAACRLYRATLVIAKLDRLSRDAAFLLSLRDAGVDFIAADMPNANRLTVGIMAMVAETERDAISARTKAALAAAKARGVKLGGDRGSRLTADQSAMGRVARTEKATARAADLGPLLSELRAAGATSLAQLAKALTTRGIPTSTGKAEWSPMQVSRVLKALA